MAHKPNRTTSSSSPQSHRLQKNPLTSPDALIEPSTGSSRRHKLAAWQHLSGSLSQPPSPLLALLNCAYPAQRPVSKPARKGTCGGLQQRSISPSGFDWSAPPFVPILALTRRNVNKDFVSYFFCIVFVIRWRRRVPVYSHFAYYYCILYFAYYSYLHWKFV